MYEADFRKFKTTFRGSNTLRKSVSYFTYNPSQFPIFNILVVNLEKKKKIIDCNTQTTQLNSRSG